MKLLKVLALCLVALPLSAQELLNTQGWFEGGTKYKTTGEDIVLSWTPHADNIPWEGNYVFDLEVIFYERQETVINEKALNQLSYTFQLNRVGHYWARVRACYANDTATCSEWSNSWSDTNRIEFDGVMVNGWWIFIWIGAPTDPGIQ
jgi:hypothetical protein